MRTYIIKSFAFFFFVLSGCDKSGPVDVDNQNGNATNKGYHLYVGNWGGTEVFVVDTDSNAVVDTIRGFPYTVWHLAATTSGGKLYVCTRNDVPPVYTGKIFSVDLKTKNMTLIHNEISDVFVSPKGLVFVISYSYKNNLSQGAIGIIDTLTDAIMYFDTLNIRDTGYNYQSVVFDKNKPLLYSVNNSHQLFAYDYDKKEIVRVYENLFGPKLQMVISPNGQTLYVAGGPVFDLERDSVIAGVGGNHLGSLALSPGGEYLYVTDPGKYLIPEPVPSGKVFIFQTSTFSYVGEIDVKKALPYGHSWATDRIVVMPHGKTAYVSNWLDLVFVLDLQSKAVVKFIRLRAQVLPMVLGLKQKP